MRIYLTGRLMVETETALLEEGEMPARQGRVAFAYLVLNRRRPIPRSELSEALWNEEPPEAWEASLSALVSRLRSVFRGARLDADITTLSGSLHLTLPADTWVDLDAARNALDEAEGCLKFGDAGAAWPQAAVACSIMERGFLHGEEHAWVRRERGRVRGEHLKALELLADIALALGDASAAARYARLCSDLEPFRESAYELEMRAELAMGNRAQALLIYERLRKLLADELGTDPSPSLQQTFMQALRG